jgi:undecaprenyl-diphosphatase
MAMKSLAAVSDRVERNMLLVVLVLATLCWGFLHLASEVGEGETYSLDMAILMAMRDAHNPKDPIGPPWFEEAVRDVTSLGSTTVLMLFVLGVVGLLIMSEAHGAAVLVFFSVIGGIVVTVLLKQAFERDRPDLVLHAAQVFSTSFPSGHATLSAVTYLTLGGLLARVQPHRGLKIYVLAVAVMLTVLVGVSRIYLGVHWPTDVVAGWMVGSAWALACWMLARRLQQQGKVEPRMK